jgi:threonine/homoserine/homoserine lactone efflux protein
MIPAQNVLAFTIAAAVLIAIPGPSVLFVIGRALALGRAGALLSVVGNALGVFVQVVGIAAGLGTLIQESIVLFTIVKFAGAAFLVYLGIQAIRHRKRPIVTDAAGRKRGAWRVLRESFIVGISNPKSIVFFIAVLPQFVAPNAGAVPLQMILLGVIFLGIALVFDSIWALAAGTARNWFARSPKRVSTLSATGGVAMIGLGGVLAFTGAKH